MLRKLSGILILFFAGLLTLSVLLTTLKIIIEPIQKTGDNAADSGQLVGKWTAIIIFAIIIFYLFKFGLKLIKNKPKTETIDDIGNEN